MRYKYNIVPKGDNIRVDVQPKLASIKKKGKYRSLLQQTLAIPSMNRAGTYMHTDNSGNAWMNPYIKYLKIGNIPDPKYNR